jgi:phosphoglycolate phosphatase
LLQAQPTASLDWLYIDTTHDLQMALTAGCVSLGVSYAAPEPDAFHALNPRHVAHSVQELRDWLLANA